MYIRFLSFISAITWPKRRVPDESLIKSDIVFFYFERHAIVTELSTSSRGRFKKKRKKSRLPKVNNFYDQVNMSYPVSSVNLDQIRDSSGLQFAKVPFN